MHKKAILAAFCLASLAAGAQNENPLWLRNASISPNGNQIAFTYQGDIYVVPTSGGEARQLTTNPAYDSYPVWSPDGSKIAFGSDREGSIDVYVVDSTGGTPKRLTTNSNGETPLAFRDNSHILYATSNMPSQESHMLLFGSQVYEVGVDGGRPRLFSTLPMDALSVDAQGRVLYQDWKGYEDTWRKHEVSSRSTDIWLMSADAKNFSKLTTYPGNDRNPVWAGDNKYFYTSEADGTLNVYAGTIGGAPKQLTHFKDHPVRNLSVATNGTMAFSWNGEIYTLKEGAEPQRVNIQITSDAYAREVIKSLRTNGVTDFSLSPKGKEVAFVMRGDVYVTSLKYKTTKQITNTPEQERTVHFAPDGRSLVYDSERNGLWQIYEAKIVRKSEKEFTYCTEIEETQLVKSDKTSFMPKYSPNGKEVAFLENRCELKVINLATKQVRTALEEKFNYSYSDGDVWFEWSPDSKWFLASYLGVGGWNNIDIALVKADGSQVTNLTESGYNDGNGKWVLGGKAMLWESDRQGYRSHGSWGSQSDAYIMFFDAEAYDKFQMSEEEVALAEDAEKAAKKAKEDAEKAKKGKKDKASKKDKTDKPKDVEDLKFDLENRTFRTLRLTPFSSYLGDLFLTEKGDKFFFTSRYDEDEDLWMSDIKKKEVKMVEKDFGRILVPDSALTTLYTYKNGIKSYKIEGGEKKNVEFEAPLDYNTAAEREYIFNHAWQQVKDKFYDANMHGVDWDMYRDAYKRFLPHINNGRDFAIMLSEMLGELNASHTGCRFYGKSVSSLPTGELGAFFDESHTGNGLKVKEVLTNGPLWTAAANVKPGEIITHINGKEILAGTDYYPFLEGCANKKVRLSVANLNGAVRSVEVTATDFSTINELLYKRWVNHNKHVVDSVSGGKVGYVHIKAMNGESYNTVYSEALGKYRNCDAIVIDTRHNGGGWLHNDVAVLFSGKEYVRYTPRGRYIGSDPFNRWTKKSAMLVGEDNYSDAHGTPYTYRALNVGKILGAPVPGTMTAVWWERQINPDFVFGIPQVTSSGSDGKALENQQLEPDILLLNTPEQTISGYDHQLIETVKYLMK